MFCKNTRTAIALHQQCVVRRGVGNVHPRRAGRHPGHGDADGLGLLLEQAFDVLGGNVSFDGVTTDLGGMAGAVAVGHAELAARGAEVVNDVRVDRETIALDVFYPAVAAFAGRTLVNVDFGLGLRIGGTAAKQGQRGQPRGAATQER